MKKTFWFFATIFIFILFTNWFGLIPGVGTIGWGVQGDHGFHVTRPLLRGGNADLNMTAAMAMLFFFFWTIWALQANGVKGFFLHLFGPKGESTGALKLLLIIIFFLVGFLEVFSILFRPVSLSFRLFGNIFGEELVIVILFSLIPFLVPLPMMFLGLITASLQAFIFMKLTMIYLSAAVATEHDHH